MGGTLFIHIFSHCVIFIPDGFQDFNRSEAFSIRWVPSAVWHGKTCPPVKCTRYATFLDKSLICVMHAVHIDVHSDW